MSGYERSGRKNTNVDVSVWVMLVYPANGR